MAKSVRKGRWVGFELEFAKNITLNDWYHNIRLGLDNPYKIWYTHHSLYVAEHKNYLIGLVVNFKNQKLYLEAVNKGDVLKFVRKEVEEGHEGIEANLFAINLKNLYGVFASLFGTISDTKLSKLFRQVHTNTKKSLIDARLSQLQENNPDCSEKLLSQEAQRTFEGEFMFTFKISTHDIDTALEHFKSLEKVKIGFVDGLPKDSWFSPMADASKRARVEFTMDKTGGVREAGSKLRSLIRHSPTYHALKIYGKSQLGEDSSIAIGDNKEGYGRFVYDDYIRGLPTEWPTDISKCSSTEMLLNVMKEYSAVFGNPPKKKFFVKPKTGVTKCGIHGGLFVSGSIPGRD